MCPTLLLLQNKSGKTASHIAARHRRAGIVRVLTDQAAKAHYRGDLEQGLASSPEEEINLLAEADTHQETNNNKDTTLHEAVRFNHLLVLEMLTRKDPEFFCAAKNLARLHFTLLSRGNIVTWYLEYLTLANIQVDKAPTV